jgi:DNA-binding winged helix-turn-helix (wHTH) protein
LHYLVTRPNRLVSKDELLDAVWPETTVSDAVVRVAIRELREVLGDAAQAPRYITTVQRRGYRFVAPVDLQPPTGQPSSTPVVPLPATLALPSISEANSTEADLQRIHVNVAVVLPQEDIDPHGLVNLLETLNGFIEAWGFELEGNTEPIRESFFQFLSFRSKRRYTADEVTTLQETAFTALQQGVHPVGDHTVSAPIAEAAFKLIEALKPFEQGAIRLGSLLVLKVISEGKSSLHVTTLSPAWVQWFDEHPELLHDPATWHTLISPSLMQTPLRSPSYDVFLCHNSHDKPVVKDIAAQLQQRGLRPWLDEWGLRAGDNWLDVLDQQISQIPVAAVFIGPYGEGPWQTQEWHAFLHRYVEKGCRVIPVILPGYQGPPQLPVFLQAFHCVDFRQTSPTPLDALVRGIHG